MSQKPESKWIPLVLSVGVIIIVVVAQIAIPAAFGKIQDPGMYGDMFGVVNALFSGLAFAGIVLAIILQRSELELQREELILTRKELSGQREQLELQTQHLTRQNQEATFFRLLQFHVDLVRAIEIREDVADFSGLTVGRACFPKFLKEFTEIARSSEVVDVDANRSHLLREANAHFLAVHASDLGPYYRNLHQLLLFVNGLTIQSKPFFVRTLAAQFSKQEAVLLFYHTLTGADEFRSLSREFGLYHAAGPNDLLDPSDANWL